MLLHLLDIFGCLFFYCLVNYLYGNEVEYICLKFVSGFHDFVYCLKNRLKFSWLDNFINNHDEVIYFFAFILFNIILYFVCTLSFRLSMYLFIYLLKGLFSFCL